MQCTSSWLFVHKPGLDMRSDILANLLCSLLLGSVAAQTASKPGATKTPSAGKQTTNNDNIVLTPIPLLTMDKVNGKNQEPNQKQPSNVQSGTNKPKTAEPAQGASAKTPPSTAPASTSASASTAAPATSNEVKLGPVHRWCATGKSPMLEL